MASFLVLPPVIPFLLLFFKICDIVILIKDRGIFMNYNIDLNWTFKQVVSNIGALRTQYEGILCSFSYFKLHDKVKAIRDFRNAIYSLNFEEWKKDRIWDCLNGDEVIYVLEEIARR